MLHATRLQFNVVDHCNLTCARCSHSSPLLPKRFLSPKELAADLALLHPHVRFNYLSLVGGEPLLHPQIVEIVRTARDSGVAGSVNLITNGVLLHRAPPETWQYIDMLFISQYPAVKSDHFEAESDRLRKAYNIKVFVRDIPEFQIIALNRPTEDAELVRAIYSACTYKNYTYTLHHGQLHLCLTAAFLTDRSAAVGNPVDNHGDGVELRANPNLQADLARFLTVEEPLQACAWCLGSSGPWLQHTLLRGRGQISAERQDRLNAQDILAALQSQPAGATSSNPLAP